MIQVIRLTGDYPQRWAAANATVAASPDVPAMVVCLHQNSAATAKRDAAGNVVLVANPAPLYSLALALADGPWVDESASLAAELARTTADRCPLHTKAPQVWMVGPGDRGEFNLRGYEMPAVVWEPGHITNPAYSAWAKSDEGQGILAGILVDTARKAMPKGGVFFVSVGHVGKTKRPHDKGVRAHGGGWEGDICNNVADLVAARFAL